MASMQDVADRANVSIATVSRVLSNPAAVRETTRRKVIDAIEALEYRVDARARSLRMNTPQTVLVIVNDLENPFITELIHGVEDAAQARGLSVLLGDSQRSPERERHYADLVKTRRAQGIIQLSARKLFVSQEGASDTPIVNALDCIDGAPYPTVQVDNRSAAREAVEHLLDLGHRRIAAIAGPEASTQSQDRLMGYRDALERAGIEPEPTLVEYADFTAGSGAEAATRLCERAPSMTAIFCFNDTMALGAISAMATKGLAVPDDVSIVGFDDVSLARYFNPPLTTVRQPATELGQTALVLLSRLMAGEHVSNERVFLDHRLVVRKSASRPRT